MTPFDDAMRRRLAPGSAAPLAVALSGGGDSLALLHLTMDWAERRGRPVVAFTVDHGLNADSPSWTRAAGDAARAVGADWRALRWEGPKPTSGVQARARAARHALLAEAARDAGARVLLMGHTADDIAEGEVMRRIDVRGLGRLREWSPSPAWPEGRGIFLLRPLLTVSRAALRELLAGRGAVWLDDPANADPRFARVRARRSLEGSPPAGGGDTALDPAIPALARRITFSPGGVAVDRAILLAAPAPVAKPVLAAALLCLSGSMRPPRGAELERLLGLIAESGVATLCGCRVDSTSDVVRLTREPGRRGVTTRPVDPADWAKARFEAACGLIADEASLASRQGVR